MNATELERRFGRMVTLSELAKYFRASVRATRAQLDERGVKIMTFGEVNVAQVVAVRDAFGLVDDGLAAEDAERDARRATRMLRPDGSRKTPTEVLLESRELGAQAVAAFGERQSR